MEFNDVGNSIDETVKSSVSDSRTEPLVNGLSNGTSIKSDRHSKHKHKDKDKDRDRKDGDKHRSKEKDRHKEHKQKDKDKERTKHADSKERHGNSKTDEKKSSNDKDKDKERKEKSKEQKKDKDRGDKSSSSSSNKHKDHKSSSSSKNKSSKHSSEKDRHSNKHKHSSKEKNHDSEKRDQIKTEVKIKTEENEDTSDRLVIDEGTYPAIVKTEPKLEIPHVKHQTNNVSIDRRDSTPEYNNFVKTEDDSEDELPLADRSLSKVKRRFAIESDEEEELPLNARKKIKKEKSNGHTKKRKTYTSDESEDELQPVKKKKSHKKEIKKETNSTETPTKKKKKNDEEEQEVWKWWEEEKKDDGVKWNFLEHKGPMFAPPYEPLPPEIKFKYDGKSMKLSQDAEEVATFYAKMLDHDYTTKEVFNKNFFKDWRKTMTSEERSVITDLKKCNFKDIQAYFLTKTEERKAMSKEEKKKIKEQNEEIAKEYGVCTIDGHKEKIGNFRIEPPGLFRGRGEHPKMGMLKKRVNPEDVIINCSKKAKVPSPPKGHKWKDVRHDQTVTWLASWTENVQGQVKYVMLNPSSKLKGEKDWQKYETARKLAKSVEKIRKDYREDWKSKEMRIRQRAVAMYFIDKLALRAGNEKDEDQADTVGCCSLRVEHIELHEQKDGKEYVVVFDFLGKDSIRYYNELPVEKRVFKNLQLFCERKKGSDDLFDRLNTAVLNKHLNELMEGLTAKVFRTFNASWTLQNQLNELTDPDASIPEKILQYNRANRAVAILCNHQRSIPKSHEKSMGNLKQKIEQKKQQVTDATRQYKDAKREAKNSSHGKVLLDKKKKALDRLKEQLMKLEVQETDKEENKTIALGTSKLNYLDPRISVAWCKKHGVPIEKIYNKTQRSKFRWAIDMAGADFVF